MSTLARQRPIRRSSSSDAKGLSFLPLTPGVCPNRGPTCEPGIRPNRSLAPTRDPSEYVCTNPVCVRIDGDNGRQALRAYRRREPGLCPNRERSHPT